MATDTYGDQFFDVIRRGCRESAAVVAPLVLEHHKAQRVVDVGCGEGWWGSEFESLGCDVLGIDGAYVTDPVIPFWPMDLAKRIDTAEPEWDLAVCLEVAEHLPPERGPSFVAELCNLAPVVLFSAAIPGQGGAGHLNEQWPDYWTALFEANGFACSGALRWAIWNDERVENWYRQNLILCARGPDRFPTWFDTPLAPVFPVVHPVLFDARRP